MVLKYKTEQRLHQKFVQFASLGGTHSPCYLNVYLYAYMCVHVYSINVNNKIHKFQQFDSIHAVSLHTHKHRNSFDVSYSSYVFNCANFSSSIYLCVSKLRKIQTCTSLSEKFGHLHQTQEYLYINWTRNVKAVPVCVEMCVEGRWNFLFQHSVRNLIEKQFFPVRF